MHGLSKAMQNVKWLNVANEMVAVRKLLIEMETNNIIESAKELCSTVNITLDYEDRYMFPDKIPEDLHAPRRVGTTFLQREY